MSSGNQRRLVVIADDYGIGPQTSAGILELAQKGIVTGSVLLVNSPYAPADVAKWRHFGQPMELGWHPNLTLDAPILPARRVPSLVSGDGTFWALGAFLKKLFWGRIRPEDIASEFKAQIQRFIELVGHPPRLVNSHQHVSIFSTVGQILLDLLSHYRPLPYVRCVREPWGLIRRIQGARLKRAFLNLHGRRMSKRQTAYGFPGNDWLGGVTDPPWVKQPTFFEDWLAAIPGDMVEMSCHPGHPDETLNGRDCEAGDGLMERRVDELKLLGRPEFLRAAKQAGFRLVYPSALVEGRIAHAA